MNTISLGIMTVFLILRTYAVYSKRLWVLCVTVPIGVVNVVLAIWSLTKVETILHTFGTGALDTCVPAVLLSETPYKVSWPMTIAFDTLISTLTIFKTYRMHREHHRIGIKSRLAAMLLQDGSLYYSVMTAANVLNFILFWTTNFNYIETSAGNSSEITHSISVIVVSRMMLNIMEASGPITDDEIEDGNDSARNHPNVSTMQFTTHFNTEGFASPTSAVGPSVQQAGQRSLQFPTGYTPR